MSNILKSPNSTTTSRSSLIETVEELGLEPETRQEILNVIQNIPPIDNTNPDTITLRNFGSDFDTNPTITYQRLGLPSGTEEERRAYEEAINTTSNRRFPRETTYQIWDPEHHGEYPLGYYFTEEGPGLHYENVQVGDHMDILQTGSVHQPYSEGPESVYRGFLIGNNERERNVRRVLNNENLVLPNYNTLSPPGYSQYQQGRPGPESFIDPDRDYTDEELINLLAANGARFRNMVRDQEDQQEIDRLRRGFNNIVRRRHLTRWRNARPRDDIVDSQG